MATKKSAGTSRNGRDSAGRRLGFKCFGGQKIQGGAIILRQRGTKFFPGSNVSMGKDHTLNANCHGIVSIRTVRGRQIVDVNPASAA